MKRYGLILAMLAALLLLASCTSNTPAPAPSPSPTAEAPAATPEPSPEPSAAPEPTVSTSADTNAYRPIGTAVKIQFDGKEVNAAPYYGKGDVILLPLQPLAEAMGWKVEKSDASGSEALLLTKADKDDVAMQYTPPSVGQNEVTGVTCKKGATDQKIDGQLLYADGTVYVPESFISEALEPVEATYDGSSLVTVKPKV